MRFGAAAVVVAAECAASSSLAVPFTVVMVVSFFLKKEDSDACIELYRRAPKDVRARSCYCAREVLAK